FGDFLFATTPEATHGGYQLGQVEVDLDAAVNERVGLSVAIAYDAEGESFGLGAFTVDFRLGDNTGEGLFSAAWLESAGIVAGMFDVPFGLDWQVYPSIDRKLISAPLVVGSTHDGWNDYGVQGYLQTSRLNAVVFGTNGYDGEFALPSEEIYTRETTAALGGRLGIMPWSGLEIGGSYARFLSEDSRDNLHLAGLDFQLHFKSFTAKGEYIRQRENWRTFDPVRVGGFYLQGMYEWGQFGLISRVERSDDPENEGEKLERFGLGGVWRVVENAEIRLEQQFTHNSDATLLQLVVGF
ncbi:MAG TPA: hypothetical protein PKV71_18535, partial [Calditrichia bacterium]|nr:hypothetical protein [Calditrichia bacterium]